MLTMLLGGARSGKSSAALRLARAQPAPVVFVATSPQIVGDSDLDARIAAHRAERPPTWQTVEAEVDLADAIAAVADDAFVIIDCLTVWLGNLLHHGHDDDAVNARSTVALSAITARACNAVAITNEVGMGIVPADAATRRYRDLLGRINQQWVGASDRASLLIAGRALELTDLDIN